MGMKVIASDDVGVSAGLCMSAGQRVRLTMVGDASEIVIVRACVSVCVSVRSAVSMVVAATADGSMVVNVRAVVSVSVSVSVC